MANLMEQIAHGIYVETGYKGANVGLVLTREGGICIDTPMIPEEALRWAQQVQKLTHGRILYVINTDHHRGHVLGNRYFPAPVIAHELAWKEMKSYGDNFRQRLMDSFKKEPAIAAQFADLRIIVPEVTFTDRLTLERGGRTVRIIHIGGHTPATSAVYIPDEKVLFAGDSVWVDQHPYMAQANSKDWLDGLTYLRKLAPDKIVPGHGPVCGRDATDRVSDYIRTLRSRVRQLQRAGRSKTEVASTLVGELVPWFPIPPDRRPKLEAQIKAGIGRVYDELKLAGS